jgi:hypothetical protein
MNIVITVKYNRKETTTLSRGTEIVTSQLSHECPTSCLERSPRSHIESKVMDTFNYPEASEIRGPSESSPDLPKTVN